MYQYYHVKIFNDRIKPKSFWHRIASFIPFTKYRKQRIESINEKELMLQYYVEQECKIRKERDRLKRDLEISRNYANWLKSKWDSDTEIMYSEKVGRYKYTI